MKIAHQTNHRYNNLGNGLFRCYQCGLDKTVIKGKILYYRDNIITSDNKCKDIVLDVDEEENRFCKGYFKSSICSNRNLCKLYSNFINNEQVLNNIYFIKIYKSRDFVQFKSCTLYRDKENIIQQPIKPKQSQKHYSLDFKLRVIKDIKSGKHSIKYPNFLILFR